MIDQPTPAPGEYSEAEFEKRMQERRSEQRLLAFCQVLDPEHNFIGVSFDLTSTGICLSLPNTWPAEVSFSVMLKRADQPQLPEVEITLAPIWRKPRNTTFDEIGGRIIDVANRPAFEQFLAHCQAAGPNGLLEDD
ncbi:hypothetical protein [Synechocystis sp. LKSZ1]|uniref:hypothetical protein n=1 Tax=Synechocystis sp. LKSZ1 TaxID=3144951 RepID=UPI00336C094A